MELKNEITRILEVAPDCELVEYNGMAYYRFQDILYVLFANWKNGKEWVDKKGQDSPMVLAVAHFSSYEQLIQALDNPSDYTEEWKIKKPE